MTRKVRKAPTRGNLMKVESGKNPPSSPFRKWGDWV
jgi:hypothetical protein